VTVFSSSNSVFPYQCHSTNIQHFYSFIHHRHHVAIQAPPKEKLNRKKNHRFCVRRYTTEIRIK